jgi:hypothetical protein
MGEGPASSFAVADVRIGVLPFPPLFAFVILSGCPARVSPASAKAKKSLPRSTLSSPLRSHTEERSDEVSLFALSAAEYQHHTAATTTFEGRRSFQPRQKAERAAPTARGAFPASLLLTLGPGPSPALSS